VKSASFCPHPEEHREALRLENEAIEVQIALQTQSIFMFKAWQALQRWRNWPISGLNSSARLARLAAQAIFEASLARW
jgi:hypothetical protein